MIAKTVLNISMLSIIDVAETKMKELKKKEWSLAKKKELESVGGGEKVQREAQRT